ncbi:MAG: hypothetical protein CMJ94_02875 [Planctomycetes bacterium]|nr:hypothetical protein [Planctomycetota bacterium]
MSSRFAILVAVAALVASPLLSTAWQEAEANNPQLVPMYDYGTVYVSRVDRGDGIHVTFGLELGPNQSWHFRVQGRIARLVAAAHETTWEPELLSADGDAFANAMLNDLKEHPELLTNIAVGLHELGSYGWEVFQVDNHSYLSTGTRSVYHVRRMEMRPPLESTSQR